MEGTVQISEDENFGWTIVSRLTDGELEVTEKKLEAVGGGPATISKRGYDEEAWNIKAEEGKAGAGNEMEMEQEGWQDAGGAIVKGGEEEAQEDELEEEEEAKSEAGEGGGGGGGGEETEGEDGLEGRKEDLQRVFTAGELICKDGARMTFPWEGDQALEAKPLLGTKQILVQKQPQNHHAGGLLWRVSLIATVGFFGWALLNGVGGGGKNFRCLKTHPCNIKEGEQLLKN